MQRRNKGRARSRRHPSKKGKIGTHYPTKLIKGGDPRKKRFRCSACGAVGSPGELKSLKKCRCPEAPRPSDIPGMEDEE